MSSIYAYSPLATSLLSPLSSPLSLYSVLGSSLTTQTSNLGSSRSADPYQTEISAYGQLLSSLYDFQYALQQLAPPYQSNTLSVASSNASVASASATTGASTASYNLSVTQLAQAQGVQSGSFADSNSTVIGSGSLSIQTGTYSSGSNTFSSDGSSPTQVAISNGTLSSIATAINNAGAGITASVQLNNGQYRLAISRNITGASKNFSITVTDNDGNNTDMSGLSQLAYDPTASVGSGKNMSLAQSGLDASYTVNGVSASSSSNNGVILSTGISANFLQTGSTTLNVNVDYNQLSSAAQNLASAVNTFQSSLNNMIGPGGALHYDSISGQLATSLDLQILSTLNNGSSNLQILTQLGLLYQTPQTAGLMGGLALNSSTLQAAYNSDQNGAASLLSIAAQGLISLSKNYSSAGNGIVPLSLNQLQRLQISHHMQGPYNKQNLFDLNTLIQQQARGTSSQSGNLTAQQIFSLSQYASVLSIGQPYALQAMLLGSLGQISSGFSAQA